MHVCMHAWMHCRVDAWMDGRMDGWMHAWNHHDFMFSCVHYPDPLGIQSDPALRLLRFDLVPLLWMAKQNADTAACLPRDSNIP